MLQTFIWWGGVRFVQENLVTKAIGSSFRFFKFVKIPIQCFQINEAQTDVVTVPQTFCFVTFFLNITGCFIDSILINNVFFKYLLVQHYTLQLSSHNGHLAYSSQFHVLQSPKWLFQSSSTPPMISLVKQQLTFLITIVIIIIIIIIIIVFIKNQ